MSQVNQPKFLRMHCLRFHVGICVIGFIAILCSSCRLDPTSSCGPDLDCPLGWFCNVNSDGENTCEFIQGCGDGVVDVGEFCDDGNLSNDDGCLRNCLPASCGDGFVNKGVEECDDGNTTTEVCDYGADSCRVCGEECFWIPGETSRCGDGIVQSQYHEACDDKNSDQCGTCSANCGVFALSNATGLITLVVARDIVDAETFTLSDGFGSQPTIFEFDKGDGHIEGNVEVDISMVGNNSLSDMRTAVIQAINQPILALKISASAEGSLSDVKLTHALPTSLGNQSTSETVSNPGFMISQLTGGAGADCAEGIGCRIGLDCKSGVCGLNNTCL